MEQSLSQREQQKDVRLEGSLTFNGHIHLLL